MNRLLAILILGLLGGCASTPPVATLDNEPPATEQQIAKRQAALSRSRQMQPGPTERYDVAVIGGTCAPKVPAKFAVTACVDEKPCNGAGFRLEDGSIVCACFQVRGGCDADSFCHARSASAPSAPTKSITCSSGDDLHRPPSEASEHEDRTTQSLVNRPMARQRVLRLSPRRRAGTPRGGSR